MTPLVPNCFRRAVAPDGWKPLCEDFAAWCTVPGNLKFSELVHASASTGSNDRVLIKFTAGGQVWIGVDGSNIGFVCDPEETLETSDVPDGGYGVSPIKHQGENHYAAWSGEYIFAEYPDAFMLATLTTTPYSNLSMSWLAHGGRIITAFNGSDAAKGLTGHGVITAMGQHSSTWTAGSGGSVPNQSRGLSVANNSTIRVNHNAYTADTLGFEQPNGIGELRTNLIRPQPTLVGIANNYLGLTRYARRDSYTATANTFGLLRVGADSDQAWVILNNSNTTPNVSWLWDRRVSVVDV